jgi:hypothetical protein
VAAGRREVRGRPRLALHLVAAIDQVDRRLGGAQDLLERDRGRAQVAELRLEARDLFVIGAHIRLRGLELLLERCGVRLLLRARLGLHALEQLLLFAQPLLRLFGELALLFGPDLGLVLEFGARGMELPGEPAHQDEQHEEEQSRHGQQHAHAGRRLLPRLPHDLLHEDRGAAEQAALAAALRFGGRPLEDELHRLGAGQLGRGNVLLRRVGAGVGATAGSGGYGGLGWGSGRRFRRWGRGVLGGCRCRRLRLGCGRGAPAVAGGVREVEAQLGAAPAEGDDVAVLQRLA